MIFTVIDIFDDIHLNVFNIIVCDDLGAGIAAEQTEDGMFESERHNRLRPYEVQLKKFNYQQVSGSDLF